MKEALEGVGLGLLISIYPAILVFNWIVETRFPETEEVAVSCLWCLI